MIFDLLCHFRNQFSVLIVFSRRDNFHKKKNRKEECEEKECEEEECDECECEEFEECE